MRRGGGFVQASWAALATVLLSLACAVHADTVQVWVSPTHGDDAAAGTSPDSPLRHLRAARDRVRALRRGGSRQRPATVWLMPGTHRLNETLNLTALDSHTKWRAVATQRGSAPSDDLPVISGGRELSWAPGSGGDLTSEPLRQCQLLRAAGVSPRPTSAAGGGVYPELYLADALVPRAQVSRQPRGAIADPGAFWEWEPLTPATNTAFRYVDSTIDPGGWGSDATVFVATAPWAFRPARIAHVNNFTVTPREPLDPKPLTKSSAGRGKRRWCILNNQQGPLLPGEYRYNSAAGG